RRRGEPGEPGDLRQRQLLRGMQGEVGPEAFQPALAVGAHHLIESRSTSRQPFEKREAIGSVRCARIVQPRRLVLVAAHPGGSSPRCGRWSRCRLTDLVGRLVIAAGGTAMAGDEVDVIVIGLGPGGEEVAERLAEAGLSVIGVEEHLVGGECPYYGCIPSKMMVRAADLLAEARRVDGMAGRVTVEA